MAVLTSTLVISLKDLVSGPAGAVKSALANLNTSATQASRAMQTVQRSHGTMVAAVNMPLALPMPTGAQSPLHQFYEFDKKNQQIAAITEAGGAKMAKLRAEIAEISNTLGIGNQELIEAAQRWTELGNKIETFPDVARIAGRTSKMGGIKTADQITGVNAMLKAYGLDPNEKKNIEHFEDVYLVASKGMAGGAHAFDEAMKQFAPVAKSMGISFEQAAALVQTLGGQFQAGEIGAALKTGFVRILRPRSGAVSQLRAAGIDLTSFMQFDEEKFNKQGGGDFGERLRGAGQIVSPELQKTFDEIFEKADVQNGTKELQDQLMKVLTDTYGRSNRKGQRVLDGETTKVFNAAIAQQIQAYRDASQGFDMAKFLDVMSKQANNVPLLDALFGVNRLPQFMDLLRQGHHYAERVHKITEEAPGAVMRKWEVFNEGFARSIDKVSAAYDGLINKSKDNGVGSDLATVLGGVAAAFRFFQDAPNWLSRSVFWLGAMAAALPVIGIYLATAGIALRTFGITSARIGAAAGWVGRMVSGLMRMSGAARLAAAGISAIGTAAAAVGAAGLLAFLMRGRSPAGAAAAAAAGTAASAAAAAKVAASSPVSAAAAAAAATAVGVGLARTGAGLRMWRALRSVGGTAGGIGARMVPGVGMGLAAWDVAKAGSVLLKGGKLISRLNPLISAAMLVYGAYDGYQTYKKTGSMLEGIKQGSGYNDLRDLFTWLGGLAKPSKPTTVKDLIVGSAAAGTLDQPSAAATVTAAGRATAAGPGTTAAAGEGEAATGQQAAAAQESVSVVQSAMDQVRSIVAGVDLTAEGQRIASTLAAGIRAGVGEITAVANEMAAAAARGAVRGAYSDGGLR